MYAPPWERPPLDLTVLSCRGPADTVAEAHLPGATDATSADFPRAVCRRKAMERSGGVVTPPHSAGIYFLFGFFFFDVIVASSCSRLRSPFAGRPSRNRSLVVRLWSCAASCLCVCVGAVRCCRCRALFPTYVSIACGHFCLLWHDRVCCRSRLVVLAFGCSFASGCFALPAAVPVVSICCLSCTHILYVMYI